MLALRLATKPLWIQILLTLAYSIPVCILGTLTSSGPLDGLVGGLLGLYICSHPARNTIDVLFANRFALARIWSTWSGRGWLALNGLVLLAGWWVIFLGMVSLIGS
jgi:hypothetical protein